MPVSSTVYIWYPRDGHIGHASMYIGQHDVNVALEEVLRGYGKTGADYNAWSPIIRADVRRYVHDNYVSWWPDDTKNINKAPQERKNTLQEDIDAERADPHTVYRIDNLNTGKMWAEWKAIADKPGANWAAGRKNCATIVLRVLKAGGIAKQLSIKNRIWFANNLYVTPKNVAAMCNDLVDQGKATKDKSANYVGKSTSVIGLIDRVTGFR